MNDNLLNFDDNQDNTKPFLSSDPLADQDSREGTTPIPPAQEEEDGEPQKAVVPPGEIDYSKPENREIARKRANELIDQGKFEEAAKILRESGMHQTVKPAPPADKQAQGAPQPPAMKTSAPSAGDTGVQPSQTAPQAPPQAPPQVQQPEEEPKPTPPVPDRPVVGGAPAAQPPEIEPKPAEVPKKPAVSPPPKPAFDRAEPPASGKDMLGPPAPPPKETAPPPPPPARSDVAPVSKQPPKAETTSEIEHPDDYLKKAYELRKDLIEYDRSKLQEEERLQAAEDLVFEGNKEEAIKIYKEIARDAEEKGEKEVAIEAMERLAALLR